jgi:hypothetical protein
MDTQSKSVLCATQSLAAENGMRGSKPPWGRGGSKEGLDEAWWGVREVLMKCGTEGWRGREDKH